MSQPLAASARRARKFPVPTSAQRHLLSRFRYGVTPALARQMRQAGGADAWFRQRLQEKR